MAMESEGSAAKRGRERRVRIVGRSPDARNDEGRDTPAHVVRHRAERQLELYVHMLRILERELAQHREANRSEAADGTQRNLVAVRLLTRRLCDEHELATPAELPCEDRSPED